MSQGGCLHVSPCRNELDRDIHDLTDRACIWAVLAISLEGTCKQALGSKQTAQYSKVQSFALVEVSQQVNLVNLDGTLEHIGAT